MKTYSIYQLRDMLRLLTDTALALNKRAQEEGGEMSRYFLCLGCEKVIPANPGNVLNPECPCDAEEVLH